MVDVAALLKVEKAQFKAVCSKPEPELPAVSFVLAELGGLAGGYLFWGSTARHREGEQDAQRGYLFHGCILSRVKEWVGDALAIPHLPPAA
ncbi:MAG: hypothetical protein ACREDH_14360 [Methylocella sp.]